MAKIIRYKRSIIIIFLIAVLFYFFFIREDENIIYFDNKISDLTQDTDVRIVKLNDLTNFRWTVAYFGRNGLYGYKLTFIDKTLDRIIDIALNKKYFIFAGSGFIGFSPMHDLFYPESLFIIKKYESISRDNSVTKRIRILVLNDKLHNMSKNILDAINNNHGVITAKNLFIFNFRIKWDRLDIYWDRSRSAYDFRFFFKDIQISQYLIDHFLLRIHQNILQNILNDKFMSIYPEDILKITGSMASINIFTLNEIIRKDG